MDAPFSFDYYAVANIINEGGAIHPQQAAAYASINNAYALSNATAQIWGLPPAVYATTQALGVAANTWNTACCSWYHAWGQVSIYQSNVAFTPGSYDATAYGLLTAAVPAAKAAADAAKDAYVKAVADCVAAISAVDGLAAKLAAPLAAVQAPLPPYVPPVVLAAPPPPPPPPPPVPQNIADLQHAVAVALNALMQVVGSAETRKAMEAAYDNLI